MTPVRSLARVLLSAVFVSGGASALRNPSPLVEPSRSVTDALAPYAKAVGLPSDPETMIRINGAVQVVGGVLLATGTATRPAALALAGSVVPTTLAGHPWWSVEDKQERRAHRIHFLKNLGLLGGLLLAAVDTQGRPGLAWRAGHLATHAQDSVRRAGHNATQRVRYGKAIVTQGARSNIRQSRMTVKAANLARRLPG